MVNPLQRRVLLHKQGDARAKRPARLSIRNDLLGLRMTGCSDSFMRAFGVTCGFHFAA